MEKSRKTFLPVLLISLFVLGLAFFSITDGSLWGDEIVRIADPIRGDLKATLRFAGSCGQPGYMLFMMLWSWLTGSSEFILRCSNLLFVPLALYYAFKIVRSRGWSDWWVLVFFVHPIFAYYMDETTPYIILYALALALIYHVYFTASFHDLRNIIAINLIYLLGVFVHFIFGFAIMFYFVECALTARKSKKLVLRHARVMAAFCLAYLPLLVFYITNLNGGQTGFGLRCILYIPYAFLGLQGTALSRNDLRAKNFDKLQPVHVVLLVLFAIVLTAMLVLCICRLRKRGGVRQFFTGNCELLLGLLGYFAVILPVAAVVHMGLWERHCIAAFPVYLILAIDVFHVLYDGKGRIVLAAYAALLCVSMGNIMFNYYYSCDDYQGVTSRIETLFSQHADLVVIDNYTTRYYSYLDAVPDPERQIVHLKDETDDEIASCFDTQEAENVLLVLFEKNCSKQLYRHFDDDPRFVVDGRYNSFKLIALTESGIQ